MIYDIWMLLFHVLLLESFRIQIFPIIPSFQILPLFIFVFVDSFIHPVIHSINSIVTCMVRSKLCNFDLTQHFSFHIPGVIASWDLLSCILGAAGPYCHMAVQELGLKVLHDKGKMVVAVLDGTRRVRLANRQSAGKEKAGLFYIS